MKVIKYTDNTFTLRKQMPISAEMKEGKIKREMMSRHQKEFNTSQG